MKKSNKKGWEEHIKSRFQDFEESPEDELWSNISKNIQPERKWLTLPSAAILLLLIGAGITFLYLQVFSKEENNSISENTSQSILTKDDGRSERSYFTEDNTHEDEFNSIEGQTNNEGEANKLRKQEALKPYGTDFYKKKDLKRNSSLPKEERQKPGSLYTKEKKQSNEEEEQFSVSGSAIVPITPTLIQPALKTPSSSSIPATIGGNLPGEKDIEGDGLFTIPPKKAIWFEESTDGGKEIMVTILPINVPEELAITENIAPQEDKMKRKNEKENTAFEIWGTLNPMLTYRQVKPNLEDDVQILSLEENQAFSMNRVGLQTSVGFSYFLTPNLAIKAGAFYRFTQNKWSYTYFIGNPDSLAVRQLNENAVSTEPVFTRNTEKVSETNQYLGALVGIQFIARGPIRKTLNLELQASREPTHAHMLYFLAFDIELEKHLFKQFYLNAGPSFIWELNGGTPNESQHYEMKPYGLGLKLGVSYKLNR